MFRPESKSVKRAVARFALANLTLGAVVFGGVSCLIDKADNLASEFCDPEIGHNIVAKSRGITVVEALYGSGIKNVQVRVPRREDLDAGNNYAYRMEQYLNDPELRMSVVVVSPLGRSGDLISNSPCTYGVPYNPRNLNYRKTVPLTDSLLQSIMPA